MRFLALLSTCRSICVFLALLYGSAAQAQTFVSKTLNSPGGTPTTITVTPSPAPTNGNFAFLAATWGSTNVTGISTAVKDSNSVSANLIDNTADTGGPAVLAGYWIAISGSPTSFTLTIPGGATGTSSLTYQEWSGVNTSSPLDGHAIQAAGAGSSSTTETSPSMTSAVSGDLLIGYIGGPLTGFATFTGASFSAAGSGSTIRNNDGAPNLTIADSSEIQTAAGASTASFTLNAAQTYIVAIAAFKASVAAACKPTLTLMGVGC